MASTPVVVEINARRYLAERDGDGWRLFVLGEWGTPLDPARPAAFAMTAGEAWTRGVPAAADLPIDELVIVVAAPDGRIGHQLITALCPPELLQ